MWSDDLRPSKRIDRVLRGHVRLEDEEPGIQSACSKYIYDGAVELLSIQGKDARRKALAKVPENIRPHIEREAWRIFDARRGR
jgi:hypothetical protein